MRNTTAKLYSLCVFFWVIPRRLNFILAYKIQTPGNYPEENIQHTEHGESLKSRIQAVLHSQRGIPEMLRAMAKPLGEVCSVTRRLLRRRLGLQTSRCVNVFFLAKGPIFFEQPLYIGIYHLFSFIITFYFYIINDKL